MNIFKRIIGLFSVEEDEAKSFRLLFLQSLLIGFANSYYYIVSSSFLLKTVNIKSLPQSYIITGIGGFLLIKLYKDLQKKYGIPGSYKMSLLIFSLICFLNFFAMYKFSSNKDFSIFLAYFTVLFAAPFTTIFSLGIFSQSARLYNISQSKRLLALILSGEIIASVLAYLSIPFLGATIKSHVFVLLPVAGIFTLLVFIPFNKLLAEYKNKFTLPVVNKDARKIDLHFFTKDRFYLLIAVTTIFSVFAIYVVDYAYLISVRYMSNITGLQIAEIVSVFFFVLKLAELSFSFLSGKILSSKGVRFSLLLLPLILLLFSAFAFVSGFVFSGIPTFLLAFLFLAKLTERAIRKSITTPSVKVLYQVAEPHERMEIEANIDGLLNQIATIFSGVLLLIISLVFFGDNMFSLLHLFSFVCIAAFALWSFFSLRMYENYSVKIKEFLSRLKSHGHVAHITNTERDANAESDLENDLTVAGKIMPALDAVSSHKKEDLIDLIKAYNVKQSIDLSVDKEDQVIRKLTNVYYSNDYYFSRLLIIRYLNFCRRDTVFEFFKELWDVSDLNCRLELIVTFNEVPHKNIEPNYFVRLCEDCVKEVMWTEAAHYDIAKLKDEALEKELDNHELLLIYLLFELLKTIYDPSVIEVIFEIIIKDDADIENQLFAIELLDITLQPGLKELVKHILEPTGFENKKHILEKTFPIYNLPPQERLVDILMKDYNLANPHLKGLALVCYDKLSEDKQVLSAFRSNSVDSLKYKADEIFTGIKDPDYELKAEILQRIENTYHVIKPFSSYLFNYALFVQHQNRLFTNSNLKKNNAPVAYTILLRSASHTAVSVDALAVAILITLKQRQLNKMAHEAVAEMSI